MSTKHFLIKPHHFKLFSTGFPSVYILTTVPDIIDNVYQNHKRVHTTICPTNKDRSCEERTTILSGVGQARSII